MFVIICYIGARNESLRAVEGRVSTPFLLSGDYPNAALQASLLSVSADVYTFDNAINRLTYPMLPKLAGSSAKRFDAHTLMPTTLKTHGNSWYHINGDDVRGEGERVARNRVVHQTTNDIRHSSNAKQNRRPAQALVDATYQSVSDIYQTQAKTEHQTERQ